MALVFYCGWYCKETVDTGHSWEPINPFYPNIRKQILHTISFQFPRRVGKDNLFNNKQKLL